MGEHLTYILSVFEPAAFLNILLSTAFGIILGAIPGLGAGIGLALVMSFTYTMDPMSGLLMLGGIYMGATYGGSISAILINCPGTASAACTSLDGSPMAKNGRGREALQYAVLASGFGGIVGILSLLLLSPILADVSLKFGPAEMFFTSLCGLIIVGSLSADKMLKGIFAMLIGLLAKLIGYNSTTGFSRLTLGLDFMYSGVDSVAAIIGLFALAEMALQGAQALKKLDRQIIDINTDKSTPLQSLKKMFVKYGKTLTKSTAIGTITGILPGAGAAIAAFLAYGEARSSSKHPEQFGTGVPEGVIAPESANNAAVGGSMVPMLSLGIPGSTNAAIMLGALVINGLTPGRSLFAEHGATVYGFIYGLFLSTILMVIMCLLFSPVFARICCVNMRYIVPAVIALSLIGAYVSRNSMADVLFAGIFAALAFIFNRFDIPLTPVLLGIVLGNIVEKNFVRVVQISDAAGMNVLTYALHSPLCLVIIAIAILLIYNNMKDSIKRDKIKKEISQ